MGMNITGSGTAAEDRINSVNPSIEYKDFSPGKLAESISA